MARMGFMTISLRVFPQPVAPLLVPQFARLAPVGVSPAALPQLIVGTAPVAVGAGEIGVQGQGLVVVLDGLLVLAEIGIGNAPVGVRAGKLGVQAQGLIVVCDR